MRTRGGWIGEADGWGCLRRRRFEAACSGNLHRGQDTPNAGFPFLSRTEERPAALGIFEPVSRNREPTAEPAPKKAATPSIETQSHPMTAVAEERRPGAILTGPRP